MSDPVTRRRPMTVDEYRALEETSDVRHEYVRGAVYAMTGATRRHNRIVTNVLRRLADAAGNGPCRVYVEAVRARVAEDVFYYPDVFVACGKPGHPSEDDAPCVVVEVLSPSTASTDLREKAAFYRQNPHVRAYLVVYQDERRVDRHFLEDGVWYETTHVSEDERIPIPCPTTSLSLAEIYEGIEREGDEEPRVRRVREDVLA